MRRGNVSRTSNLLILACWKFFLTIGNTDYPKVPVSINKNILLTQIHYTVYLYSINILWVSALSHINY